MTLLWHLGIALATLIAMEPAVAWVHRHIMHGWGWRWHRSHHAPRRGWFEVNDFYAVVAMAATIGLFFLSDPDHALWWVALGISLYGLLYAVVHDGLVHRRFPFRGRPRHAYLRRLVEAHHLHHAVREREGAISFGFLYAPPVETLRAQLKQERAAHASVH